MKKEKNYIFEVRQEFANKDLKTLYFNTNIPLYCFETEKTFYFTILPEGILAEFSKKIIESLFYETKYYLYRKFKEYEFLEEEISTTFQTGSFDNDLIINYLDDLLLRLYDAVNTIQDKEDRRDVLALLRQVEEVYVDFTNVPNGYLIPENYGVIQTEIL